MDSKCANSWCSATRRDHEGKLFRLDIDLGNKGADTMHPKVEVTGNTVTLRLLKNEPMQVADPEGPYRRAN